MDADLSALQRFSEVPFVIEGSATTGGLMAASAQAVSRLRIALDPKGLPVERYRDMISRLQSDINGRLGYGNAYRIDVIDRTRDIASQERHIDQGAVGFAKAMAKSDPQGAYSAPYLGQHGKACLLMGFPAGFDVAAMLASPLGEGARVPLRGLDADGFHWFSLRHELGHCLLGASESRAETFAALMSLRDGRLDAEGIAQIARFREASEWRNPDPDDDHYVSAALWEVVRRADALKGSARFMAMSMEEVAESARSLSDRYALSGPEMRDAMALRRGLNAAAVMPFHEVSGKVGSQRVSFEAWVSAHAGIPELARMGLAMNALATGKGHLSAFRVDLKAFKDGMAAMSQKGDATAGAILKGMRHPHRAPHVDPDFASQIPVARTAVAIDEAMPTVTGDLALRGSLEETDDAGPSPGMR